MESLELERVAFHGTCRQGKHRYLLTLLKFFHLLRSREQHQEGIQLHKKNLKFLQKKIVKYIRVMYDTLMDYQ